MTSLETMTTRTHVDAVPRDRSSPTNFPRALGTAVLSLALVAGGCDDDSVAVGETGLDPGTFEATVSGDVSQSIDGTAVFQTLVEPQGERFGHVIQLTPLTEGDTDVGWLILATDSSEPPEGTFPVVEITEEDLEGAAAGTLPDVLAEGFGYLGFFGVADEWVSFVLSEAGQVALTRTADGGLEGSFEAEAHGEIVDFTGDMAQELAVALTGAFNAIAGVVDP